jgi:hypothetical protein
MAPITAATSAGKATARSSGTVLSPMLKEAMA